MDDVKNKKNISENNIPHYLDWSFVGKSGIYRYLLGVISAFVIFFLLGALFAYPYTVINPEFNKSIITSNLYNIIAFVVPFILIPLMVRFIHKRPFWSVGFREFKIEKWNLAVGFILPIIVSLIALTISNYLGYIELKFVGINWNLWLPMLLIGVFGLFIQTASEEFLYRGYFAQVIRRFIKSPFIIILVTAYLFASPHMGNLGTGNGLLGMLPYFINGVLFGWVAYKTKSLWMSIGLHWSNNFSILLIAGSTNDLLKPVSPIQYNLPSIWVLSISVALQAILIAIIINYLLSKRYRNQEGKIS